MLATGAWSLNHCGRQEEFLGKVGNRDIAFEEWSTVGGFLGCLRGHPVVPSVSKTAVVVGEGSAFVAGGVGAGDWGPGRAELGCRDLGQVC